MLKYREVFYTFNANQVGAAQAIAELDTGLNGCSPYVIGDTVTVFMHVYANSKYQAEHYKEAEEFVNKTLKTYRLEYKKLRFKD